MYKSAALSSGIRKPHIQIPQRMNSCKYTIIRRIGPIICTGRYLLRSSFGSHILPSQRNQSPHKSGGCNPQPKPTIYEQLFSATFAQTMGCGHSGHEVKTTLKPYFVIPLSLDDATLADLERSLISWCGPHAMSGLDVPGLLTSG
jgi:hypothetical protein